jgi:ADP-ribosylglycohydrolase
MKEQARSMVLASFVADSLALGAHWIYDTAKIDQQFGRITELLPPHEDTYHPSKNLGDFTHYGDQSFHLLEHLTTHGGHFDIAEYSRDWRSFMKNEDTLEEALIETVMAGGDSAARGMVVGMLLGAYQGRDKIHPHWLEKLSKYKQIKGALDKLP